MNFGSNNKNETKMTVEKIKEVRFMKCATMLRKQYGAKISHAYCEVDDTKGSSIILKNH